MERESEGTKGMMGGKDGKKAGRRGDEMIAVMNIVIIMMKGGVRERKKWRGRARAIEGHGRKDVREGDESCKKDNNNKDKLRSER